MSRWPPRLATRLGVVLGIALAACSGPDSQGEPPRPSAMPEGPAVVYVVNYPLKYFAERIGGGQVRVEFPAPADVDPAFWVPDAETVVAYQHADLILLNGATYAKWVDRVSLPHAKLVDTSVGFRDRYIELADAVRHRHGPEGEHAHGDLAFTTWLDPTLAVKQAEAVRDALGRLRPEEQATFRAGFEALARDLRDLDVKMEAIVASAPSRPLVGSHPVYQYLTRRYGLNLESVHWEPDLVPNENMLRELEALLEAHPARWMAWEETPLAESVETLRRLGIESVVFTPSANVPGDGDFLSVMRDNVASLEDVFSR